MRARAGAARAVTVLVLVLLTACSPTSGPTPGGPVPSSASSSPEPTMEEVIAELTTLRETAQAALDEELGERRWEVSSPEGDVVSRAACAPDADVEGETAYLPGHGFRGTYPAAQWKRAARIVLQTARDHGFTTDVVLTDEPGDYLVEAHRSDGAQLQLGFAVNTTLSVETGCHRWATTPDPGPVPTD